eukprot:4327971-Prorocentrum_lima.AAC.1
MTLLAVTMTIHSLSAVVLSVTPRLITNDHWLTQMDLTSTRSAYAQPSRRLLGHSLANTP